MPDQHIIYNRPFHVFSRVHACGLVAIFIGWSVAMLQELSPVNVLVVLAMWAAAIPLALYLTARFWAVRATSSELVLQRLWRTRRVPLSSVVDVTVPLLARLNRPFWPERRLRLDDGSSIAFVSCQWGLDKLEQLRNSAADAAGT